MAKQVIKVGGTGADSRRVLEALTPVTGVEAPAVKADYVGQMFIDTVAKKIYVAIAVGSEVAADDWQEVAPVAAG